MLRGVEGNEASRARSKTASKTFGGWCTAHLSVGTLAVDELVPGEVTRKAGEAWRACTRLVQEYGPWVRARKRGGPGAKTFTAWRKVVGVPAFGTVTSLICACSGGCGGGGSGGGRTCVCV